MEESDDFEFVNMEAIMTMVLEESDDISKELLYPRRTGMLDLCLDNWESKSSRIALIN